MLELFTFRISHFSEKVRWLLDASSTEYHEVHWTPFFHVLPALALGRGGTTVPILRHRDGYVQDSTRILLWLDRNMPGFQLLPRDAEQRRQTMAWEERFDRVGAHVMRYAYGHTLQDREAVLRLWTLDAGPWQRRTLEAGFPLAAALFRNRTKLSPEALVRSTAHIEAALEDLESHLADGHEFLVGDSLSAADITTCALLAPLVGPTEHPVYGREDFRQALAAPLDGWSSRPAFEWVRHRYRTRYSPR